MSEDLLVVVRWVWTVIAAGGFVAAIWCVLDTVRDLDALRAEKVPPSSAIVLVARTERRGHLVRAAVEAAFLIVGVGTLVFERPSPVWWALTTLMLLSGAAAAIAANGVADVLARRRLRAVVHLNSDLDAMVMATASTAEAAAATAEQAGVAAEQAVATRDIAIAAREDDDPPIP